jgi:trimethylamine--corrinoid protein Co-methyltransferase
MLESMLTVAYEQFVIDDEIIGMCCKVLKSIAVDTEHLALEVIETVGPGGNFMTADHTMDHLHTEYFRGNSVTDQKDRDNWTEDGSPDARKRAGDIARKILSGKARSHIDPEVDQAIREKYDILL